MADYTVVKGDTLSKIAAANGISLQELLNANPDIKDPNLIIIGQNIVIPGDNTSTDTTKTDNNNTDTTKTDNNNQGQDPNAKPDVPDLFILGSPTLKWYHDADTGKWYASYTLSHSGKELIFEATQDQIDRIFGKGNTPKDYTDQSFSNLVGSDNVIFGGGIGAMATENKGDTFEQEVNRVLALALDNGTLPDWAKNDPKALDLLYIAQAQNKSQDWLLEQISKLQSFKNRFPGLDKFRQLGGLALDEGITGYLEFEAGLKTSLAASGLDPTAVNPQLVGELLGKGWNLTAAQNTIASITRLKDFQPALTAFNSILKEKGVAPITTQQAALDFIEGRSPKEMYDIWEASSIAEAAQQAGLGDLFTAEDAIRIGLAGEFTLDTATQASQKAAQLLLRLRHEVDVGKFGLNHEDLIDLSFGQKPRSGASMAEVSDNVSRAVQAAQQYIQTKAATPYQGFTSGGAVQAGSLGNLRPTT